MEKIVLFCIFSIGVFADFNQLERHCLSCHKAQQIPSNLIYRRYLMKYSTTKQIEDAMFNYLKNPKKERSILPAQFFLKFPMKKALQLNDVELQQSIKAYVEQFDVKKKLILENSSH